MILLNDFYSINDLQSSPSEIQASLTLNPQHKIFSGHFPSQPVVPGVCQLQMIKEILEQVTGRPSNLTSAADMKFLAVIDPQRNSQVDAQIKYTEADGKLSFTASIEKGETVFFKCKAVLVTI